MAVSTELIQHLTALLARWDQLAEGALYETERLRDQSDFYCGLLLGIELTRGQLARVVAEAIYTPMDGPGA